jgi:hypothetical protein
VQDSQVLNYLYNLEKIKYFDKIYLLVGNFKENRFDNDKISIINYKVYGEYYFIHIITSIIFSIKLLSILIKHKKEKIIVHIRSEIPLNYVPMKMLNLFFNVRFICDFRGAIDEELYKFNSRINFIIKLKKLLIKNSQNILKREKITRTFVTPYLMNYYRKRIGKSSSVDFITESMVDENFLFNIEDRVTLRRKFNIPDDRIVILYSVGGDENWQNVETIFEALNPSKYTVLLLTKKKIIACDGLIVDYISYSQMPAYLSCADFGLLFREKDTMNNVALPVKSLEYLSSGLPIIRNQVIFYLEDILVNDLNGHIINNLRDITNLELKQLNVSDRYKLSKFYLNNFGTVNIINKYLKIYNYLNFK